jgi:hypothetical protein
MVRYSLKSILILISDSDTNSLPEIGKDVMSLSLDYYFHYTSFCLNTHFLRHLTSHIISPLQTTAVQRSMASAINILQISRNLGPARRDQLRYFPGFLFVTLSFCCSFVLQAIKSFPTIFSDSEEHIDLVRKTAAFMVDLGVDRSHGAGAAGRNILGQLESIVEVMNQSRPVESPNIQNHTSGSLSGETHNRQEHVTFDGILVGDEDQLYSNSIFDWPGFFNTRFQGIDYDYGQM